MQIKIRCLKFKQKRDIQMFIKFTTNKLNRILVELSKRLIFGSCVLFNYYGNENSLKKMSIIDI